MSIERKYAPLVHFTRREVVPDLVPHLPEIKHDLGHIYWAGEQGTSVVISAPHAAAPLRQETAEAEFPESRFQRTNSPLRSSVRVPDSKSVDTETTAEPQIDVGRLIVNAAERENIRHTWYADTHSGLLAAEIAASLHKDEITPAPHLCEATFSRMYAEYNSNSTDTSGNPIVDIRVFSEEGLMKLGITSDDHPIVVRGLTRLRNHLYEASAAAISDEQLQLIKGSRNDIEHAEDWVLSVRDAVQELRSLVERDPRAAQVYAYVQGSLLALRTHRKYHERVHQMLLECEGEHTLNLDFHTCYSSRKTDEKVDLILGSRIGSCTEPSIELDLARYLSNAGFVVNISTLSSYPLTSSELRVDVHDGLAAYLKYLEAGDILSDQEKDELKSVDGKSDDEARTILHDEWQRRLESADQVNLELLAKKIKVQYVGKLPTIDDINQQINVYLEELTSTELHLYAKQMVANRLVATTGIHADKITPGLWGPNTLNSKRDWLEKQAPERTFSGIQVEIPTCNLLDDEIRGRMRDTFVRFIKDNN